MPVSLGFGLWLFANQIPQCVAIVEVFQDKWVFSELIFHYIHLLLRVAHLSGKTIPALVIVITLVIINLVIHDLFQSFLINVDVTLLSLRASGCLYLGCVNYPGTV